MGLSVSPFAREFECFTACAELQSVSRAAEHLGLQQAGLSKIIKKLEERFGEKLFYRRPQGLLLTETGEALQASLRKTKIFWKDLHADLGAPGPLTLGCHRSIASNLFPQLISPLVERFPGLQLETRFLTSLEVTQKVSVLDMDLGFVINPIKNPELIIRKIESQYVAVWTHRQQNPRALLYNPEMYLLPRWLKKLNHFKMVPICDYEVLAQIAKKSPVAALLPNRVAERYGLMQLKEPLFSVDLAMIWHKDRFKNSKRAEILNFVKKLILN